MNIYQNREKVEWSNFYWVNANDNVSERVLLIGDSIAVGYRPFVTEILNNNLTVDLFATSKSICDLSFKKELTYILNEYNYKAIHFNNGLHGWHLTDNEYRNGLGKLVEILKKSEVQLIFATSTPVTEINDTSNIDILKNDIVISRNVVATKIMSEKNIPVNDLYNLVSGNSKIRELDKFHFNSAGQKLLGEAVAKNILKCLG